jgi:adenylate cyclase
MGLQYGDVIQEGNDVFGNTVNIAAYLTAVALPQQIAITDTTFAMLSAPLKTIARPIFRTLLKGQAAEATIYQILWKNDNPDLTDSFFSTRTPVLLPGDQGGLVLQYRDQLLRLNHQSPRIVLGRDPGCDLVISDRYASRQHARIELDGMNFYLIDRSINGTYLKFDDRPEISVLRRDVLLDGAGKISLGRSFDESPTEVITISSDRRSLFRV